MTTENNQNGRASREWLVEMAAAEAEYDTVAVGGLASVFEFPVYPSNVLLPWVFGRFLEFARRARGRSVEELAQEADVDLAELVALERDGGVQPKTRTIYQLANVLGLSTAKLMELAGLAQPKDSAVGEAALRFAARSEPIAKLSKEEQEALEELVGVLAESSD